MYMNDEKQVTLCRSSSSLSTMIGSLTSFMCNYYKMHFPKGYIKKVYMGDSLANQNIGENIFQDQNKPYLMFHTQFELGNSIMNELPYWHTTNLYLFRNKARYYRKIFEDADNGIRIYAVPDRVKVNYQANIKVQMQMAAWDLLSYIRQHFDFGGYRYANHVMLQSEIPKTFIKTICNVMKWNYNSKEDRFKLQKYLKEHSLNSISEVINLSTGNPSFMFNYYNNILIHYPNTPTSDKSTRNLIMNSSQVNFEMSAEVWLPCAFIIEFEKQVDKENFDMEEEIQLMGKDKFKYNLVCEKEIIPPTVDEDNKHLIYRRSFIPDCDVEVDEIEFSAILDQDFINTVKVLKKCRLDPNKFIRVNVYANGHKISEERYNVDFDTFTLRTKEPNSNVTYMLAVYGNLEVLNEINNLILTDNGKKLEQYLLQFR